MVTPEVEHFLRKHDRRQDDWNDVFGKQFSQTTRSLLDIDAQYDFNPERLRLFKDGTRQFTIYNAVAGFTDNADHYLLSPAAGETMHIESAESLTNLNNYSLQSAFHFQLQQSLRSGDVLQVGPRSGSDGWFLEQRGADHDDSTVDIKQLSGNTESTLRADVTLPKPTTDWTRYETRFSWPQGNQEWRQSYTDDGRQFNELVAETANTNARGPEIGNVNLWYEVQADAATTGLELEVGSTGGISIGDPTKLTRSKPQLVTVDQPNTDNTWLAQYALRIDPDKPNVNARMRAVDMLSFGNNDLVELAVASVDPSKTDISDSDFGEPAIHHAYNSAIQEAYAGDNATFEVPDDTGTQKTLTSSDQFGGYTLGSAYLSAGGNTVTTEGTSTAATESKKSILGSDQIIFMTRSATSGADAGFVWAAEQDW